jgi:DNA-binding CsgD family transcriptional regulator
MGLSAGDVRSGEELRSAAAIEARELAERADFGQVLATEVVSHVGGELEIVEVSPEATLDGPWRGRALAVEELRWFRVPHIGSSPVPLPPACVDRGSLPYVDRPVLSGAVLDAWRRLDHGTRSAVVLSGEAGSGKSRVASGAARHLHQQGALVIWGRCSAESDLPYEPFVEGLRRLLGHLDPVERTRLAGAYAPELAQLLPQLHLHAGERTPGGGDTTTRRYWLFDAVAALLELLSAHGPILLVIDDLHLARRSTTLLLDHLLVSERDLHLCVLLTTRSDHAEVSEPARTFLGQAVRTAELDRVKVEGLDVQELRQLLKLLVGHGLGADLEGLAVQLAVLTGGNPFLVGEVWKELVRKGHVRTDGRRWSFDGDLASLTSPDTVRDLISHRVEALGETAAELLQIAATIGEEFEVDLAATAAEMERSAIASARRAGVIDEVGPGSYRFRQNLIWRAVSESRSSTERCAAHLVVATALEQRDPGRSTRIGWHHVQAVPLSDPRVAYQWARISAEQVTTTGMYDEAAECLRAVLEVADNEQMRAEVLIDLSGVLAAGGAIEAGVTAASAAAEIALQLGDAERLVGAALCFQELVWRADGRIDHRRDLLAAALEVAGDCERARLLGARAASLTFEGLDADAVVTGTEAIAVARDSCDPRALARVIHSVSFSGWLQPSVLVSRLELAIEAAELSRSVGDLEREVRLLMKQGFAQSALGHGEALAGTVDSLQRLAPRVRVPFLIAATAAFGAVVTLGQGDLEGADGFTAEFEKRSDRLREPMAGLGVLTFALRREQGRLAELRPFAETIDRLGAGDHSWGPGLAALYAEVRLADKASALLDRLLGDGLAAYPPDHMQLVTLSLLADACVATSRPGAETVAAALEPWSGYCIWAPGLACYGAVDRYLGRLAAAQGRSGDAGLPGLQKKAERCIEVSQRPRPPSDHSPQPLTPREIEVLKLVAEGRSNREIGERLHTSRHTVANQIHSILTKTGCANRVEAVTWATRRDLIGL